MGAYLSEPVTEKISSDESGKHVSYGAASMQGWRINQEDAHNCIINYDDDDTSFFAVYDGHGGAEVAKYCAAKLPDFIKSLPSYKEGRLDDALSEGFLKFDATLITPEVLAELKLLAGTNSEGEASEGDAAEGDSPEEDEAEMLNAEAMMPIEELLERYGGKARKQEGGANGAKTEGEKKGGDRAKEEGTKMVNGECVERSGGKVKNGEEHGAKQEAASSKPLVSDAAEAQEDGGEGSSGSAGNSRPRKSKSYEALVRDEEISDSSEDSDESSQEEEDGEEDEEEEEDDEEGDEDGEENCLPLQMLRRSLAQQDAMSSIDTEAAGYDSGCTAVVGVVKGRRLFVANAGDSRCVVCRSGRAVDMSVDHKPEEAVELSRIERAGGNVTKDGRVNGGLNLSRAIGDHSYKCNKDLEAKDQMITALPDIRTLDIDPETDKFMVLACDGIWNNMSSQEVVDFVSEKLEGGTMPLSKICENIFDTCLAPDTTGDGTGCDNMTCIVVQFHPKRPIDEQKKRTASADSEEGEGNPKKKSRSEGASPPAAEVMATT